MICQNSVQFYAFHAITELNNIWFGTAIAQCKNKGLFRNPLTNYRPVLLYSQLLFRELLKQRPPVTEQFFKASDRSSVKFMILVSGKLLWDLLFLQFETKQATGSEQWQISTKWLKKDLQIEVDENEKDWTVNSAIPKNTQKTMQFG